ncbi:MAG: competence/damage-inducible protein A [Rhodobacteraceae bacterium]|nr:competence/damage-inducible protein A [Paracoccaceae bacterium]
MPKNTSPNAAILIIGNEILSGRTKDLNSSYLAQKLLYVGISVCEIRVVSDNKVEIIAALNTLRKRFDYVFTSGGIGPTHDDITADCVAEAFGVQLPINDEAKKIIASHYPRGEADLNEARLRMARIPVGAALIENPVSKAPGFYIENAYVLAGVPKIFQAMVNFVLPKLKSSSPIISRTITISKQEGEIANDLSQIAANFSPLSIGSYPFEHKGNFGVNVVVTGKDLNQINLASDLISKI